VQYWSCCWKSQVAAFFSYYHLSENTENISLQATFTLDNLISPGDDVVAAAHHKLNSV
jgi:hypothetical protein